jgi:type II secretory pathway component PulK
MFNERLRRNKGSIFIVVMAVVGAMAVISEGMIYATRVEGKMCRVYVERVERFYLGAGAMERIKAEIVSSSNIKEITEVCRMEADAKDEGLLDEAWILNYRVRDEFSMLGLNSSDVSGWEDVEGISNEFAAVAADWIDGDDICNNEGAEREEYAEFGFAAKNKKAEIVREMMFFKGVDAQRYKDSLVKLFTVCGDGRVNINTASKKVIASMGGLGERTGELIESHQNKTDENVIESSDDILKISGLSELEVELLGQYCRYDTDIFRVFVEVETAGGENEFMGTIKKDNNKCEVVSWEIIR